MGLYPYYTDSPNYFNLAYHYNKVEIEVLPRADRFLHLSIIFKRFLKKKLTENHSHWDKWYRALYLHHSSSKFHSQPNHLANQMLRLLLVKRNAVLRVVPQAEGNGSSWQCFFQWLQQSILLISSYEDLQKYINIYICMYVLNCKLHKSEARWSPVNTEEKSLQHC